MALIQGTFYSETLHKLTNYTALLPEKESQALSCMYLLHGRSGNSGSWLNQTSIYRYHAAFPVAIFCPEVDLSYYTNMCAGGNYWDFFTQEFPTKMQQFHPNHYHKTFVCGNSMGGYGALKWALAEPTRFDFVGLLSPLVDVRRLFSLFPETLREFEAVFGSTENYTLAGHDLLQKLDTCDPLTLPPMIHLCGKNDFLYEDNLQLNKRLQTVSRHCQTFFDDHSHDWEAWDKGIHLIIHFLKNWEED